MSDLAVQDISSGPAAVHGDIGTVWNVARNVQGSVIRQERRTISDWSNTALAVFDWKDVSGVQDASNDCHTSLAADNEDWVMEGCYDDPNYNTPGFLYETGAYEDEIIQIAMDGSQRIRRLVHHRSLVNNLSDSSGYWAAPKPTISLDGRFIAFTSNWENSGRTDLFIIRVPRAAALAFEDDFNDNSLDAKKWVDTVFSLAADNGWYRFLTEHGQLYMGQYVNGVSSGATPVTYSPTTHRHWRVRHDPSADTVYWETSSDGSTWTARHSATRQLDITRLSADLNVRTWQSESSPGVAYFDNFKFEGNP